MVKVKYPVVTAVVFLWIGFICAISFMEAWLKFQAPGITLPLGLGIGKLVFNALNKVECFFAVVIIVRAFLVKDRSISPEYILFIIPGILLIVQTVWLLPALNTYADMLIEGKSVSSGNLHFYYVSAEITKVFCLSVFGIKLFN